ncbi:MULTISPECIES: hypothetical protein [Rhodopirellula]|uniref:Uncharacterized protein n=2 Tax=Rhodopirellula TaxID=265488 RepID=M5RXV0_9BACT|nr:MULTISPECIES: hypothetical protein [Rhodopirellula]EMI24183.1 hypothetical protein RESH_05248 [Rhodopirellula europaea SH398]PHQ35054.1 hypothetical protein CEE69_11550 [Rhodopirellula bahusiensis]
MKSTIYIGLSLLVLLAIGCKDGTGVAEGPSHNRYDLDSGKTQYEAETEPAGAMPVGEAREKTEDGKDVTLVGLIGGSSEPFVKGLAAFTIVDPKVPYCASEEGCPTPWDYCCETDAVKQNIATVKIVDDSGKPVTQDAREFLNVKELSTVVVKGKARRDEQGNLTVAASKIFVKKD